MPPRKTFKHRCPDIEFGGILDSLMATLLNQARAGCSRHVPGFLKLILCGSLVCVFVCVHVCVHARGY